MTRYFGDQHFILRRRVIWDGISMVEVNNSWEQIVKELRTEADPRKRKELERDLNSALERAGFQKFSPRVSQPSDDQAEDK